MLIDIIAGARPNFMKVAPIIHQIKKRQDEGGTLQYRLVHTGQHYDKKMSGSFFEQLNIPEPDVNLESGSGTQAEQTAKIMVRYEALLLEKPCDLTLVVGDVTSTMACSIAAKKLNIKVAHVEAGIRSFDLTMPEEINRMVTDSITDFFFTTSETANKNLYNAGVSKEQVHFVGNTMIDTLRANESRLQKPDIWDQLDLQEKKYLVMTMHRPANVDEEAKLGYLEFNYLVKGALAVITDSGGITEETTVMGVPCMTLRDNTERPETCEIGTNELIGTDIKAIPPAMEKLLSGNWKKGSIPELWDGKTAERIVAILEQL